MAGYNLHECAVQAEAALEKLATELASAGLDKPTVDTVSKMASVTRRIVQALGQGQEQTADDAPPAPQQPQTLDSATSAMYAQMAAARSGR